MSIQAVGWVLEHSESLGAERLVLLAIANHCDAHWCCYPSVPMIAREARLSERTVMRCVQALVQLGELEVARGGRGRGQRSTYRVGHYKGCQNVTLNPSFTLTSAPEKGDNCVTQTIKEPELHARAHERPPSSDPALRLAQARAALRGEP